MDEPTGRLRLTTIIGEHLPPVLGALITGYWSNDYGIDTLRKKMRHATGEYRHVWRAIVESVYLSTSVYKVGIRWATGNDYPEINAYFVEAGETCIHHYEDIGGYENEDYMPCGANKYVADHTEWPYCCRIDKHSEGYYCSCEQHYNGLRRETLGIEWIDNVPAE